MDNKLTLKNNLKEIRMLKGFSQQELAEMAGTTRQTIIAIEKGDYNPTIKLVLVLALALDTKVEDLFYF